MESVDNGEHLHLLKMDKQTEFQYDYEEQTLGGIGVIRASGYRQCQKEAAESLYYRVREDTGLTETQIKLIPYYAWANRGVNEMQVWIRYN